MMNEATPPSSPPIISEPTASAIGLPTKQTTDKGAFTSNEIQTVTDFQSVIMLMLNNNVVNNGLNG